MAGRLQFTKDEAQAAATIPNKQKALQKKQMLTRPAASAVHAAEVSAHVEISQYEQDNVGVEAANRGAETAEVGVRVIDRHAEQKKLTRKKQSEALSEDGPKKKAEAKDNDRPNRQPGRRDGRPQRESGSVRSESRQEGRQSALRHAHGDGDHSESRRDSFHPGEAKHQNHAHEGRGSARSAPRQQSASSASRNAVEKKQSAKLQQKRSIKREYAAAKRNGKSATESFSTVTSRVKESLSETGKKAVQFVKKHKGGAIIGIGLFMVVAIGINLMGGGAALSSGTTAVVDATTYPSADEDIEDWAFADCRSLAQIVLPCSIKRIGEKAFSWCTRIEQVSIPGSVTRIGEYAFFNCHSLKAVQIQEGVVHIGEGAFGECSKLSSVMIPDSVQSIGDYAFYQCQCFVENLCQKEGVSGVKLEITQKK